MANTVLKTATPQTSRATAAIILLLAAIALTAPACRRTETTAPKTHTEEPREPLKFVREIGTNLTSRGNLSGPAELVILNDGDILVLDRFNNRIQKYGPAGDYAGTWGRTPKGRSFPFTFPVDIARDRTTGKIIVGVINNISDDDMANFRAGLFRADTFLTFNQDGTFNGTEETVKQLRESPARDPDFKQIVDNVFWNRNELLPLSIFARIASDSASAPELWETLIGKAAKVSPGSDERTLFRLKTEYRTISEFCDVETIGGYLYLTGCLRRADVYRAPISQLRSGRYDATLFIPRPEKEYIAATADTRPDIFRAIPGDGFALYFAVDNRIFLYDASGTPTGAIDVKPRVYYASDIASDRKGGFYISDYVADCVLHISPTGELIRKFGTRRDAPGQFAGRSFTLFIVGPEKGETARPAGVTGAAMTPSGDIFAADAGNHSIQKFSRSGKPIARFTPCNGIPGPCHPVDVTYANGALYASLLGPAAIVKLDPATGKSLALWKLEKKSATAPCPFCGIGADNSGNIYASDGENIYKLGPDLKPDTAWDIKSFVIPQLSNPNDIAIGGDGTFYLAGTRGAGVLASSSAACAFTPSAGRPKLRECFNIPNLYHPRSIAAAGDMVLISNSGRDNLILLNSDGAALASWGGEGRGPASFQNPLGVSIYKDGSIIAADNGNERVQLFKADLKQLTGK